jgi:hypothetical protein
MKLITELVESHKESEYNDYSLNIFNLTNNYKDLVLWVIREDYKSITVSYYTSGMIIIIPDKDKDKRIILNRDKYSGLLNNREFYKEIIINKNKNK